jgi:hypothetical protein
MKLSSRIPVLAIGVLACNSTATGPRTLAYTAVANVVAQVPTKVELHGTIRNDGSQSFTIHTGACSVGYRLYSYSLVQSASASPAYEFNPANELCIAIAYQKVLAPGQEYAMNSGPLTLSGLVAPGKYELRVTMYHDGVVGEASAGQINIQ